MFQGILKMGWVRRKLGFELRQFHYRDLGIEAPLGEGLKCPILHQDYWHSFEEIFISGEYRAVFEKIQPPQRWLDLGCHAGFFSLWVALERRRRGLNDGSALLVDGDSRVRESVERISEVNHLKFEFLHRAIANGRETRFEAKEVMASAVGGKGTMVPVATAQELSGTFDLVKVDIEGAEMDFLRNYKEVLMETRFLVLEWHSWGGSLAEVRNAAAGFREIAEIVPSHDVGEGRSCGVVLFERDGN